MTKLRSMASGKKNNIQTKQLLTHEAIKNIIKKEGIFYTDTVVQVLFSMSYRPTCYNTAQRLDDIELIVRLLRPPRKPKLVTDCSA